MKERFESTSIIGFGVAYRADQVNKYVAESEASLAAKDAEIARLLESLRVIAKHTDADDAESYRADDREGCLDAVHDRACKAIADAGEPPPHPDTARIDKLPQCFHMLRFRDCQWHFTFDTNRQHYSLRDAIDGYSHPAVPGIDQGQFLAECGGGNAAFGERNSGGTPE